MTIRNRLALFFTGMAAFMLLALAGLLLTLATANRTSEFFKTLEKEALTKANVLMKSRIDAATLQQIYKNNRQTLSEVEVAIYNSNNELVYHDAVDIDIVKETPALLEAIRMQKSLRWVQQEYEVLGMVWQHEGNTYLLTAAAIDEAGRAKLAFLYKATAVAGFLLVVVAAILSRWVAGKALRPIAALAANTQTLGYSNMHHRLPMPPQPDEVHALTASFNQLLSRLEAALDNEKAFVSHAAHQLRTPLSTMLTRLQLAMSTHPADAALHSTVAQTIQDIQQYHQMLSSLLHLSKAASDPALVVMQPQRMDELLLDAMQQLQQQQSHYRITIDFAALAQHDDPPLVQGNYDLLFQAVLNVVDNACRYSPDHTATFTLSSDQSNICLACRDNGPGIHHALLPKVCTPFVKGPASKGAGIGLALVQKVIALHGGSLEFRNVAGGGFEVVISLPATYEGAA